MKFLISIISIVILLGMIGCTMQNTGGLITVQKWFCVISFFMSLFCGFIAIFAKNDNTKTNSGIVGLVFLVVALILLFSNP